MNCQPKNAATRRYTRRFAPAMILYVLFLFLSVWLVKHHHPTGAAVYALAVLPALPLLATMVIVGLYLTEEQDEFQRNVLIQSMLCGIGATLSLATVWGFLELLANVPHIDAYLAYPIFWFFVGIATPIVRRRYR